MDDYCIQRGTLFDNSNVQTLGPDGPIEHSVHCLIEVAPCVQSPFEILVPLEDGSGNYGRAWRIEDNSDIVSHVKQIGDCSDCDGGGDLKKGYQATLNATVLNLGTNSTPALIRVTTVQDFDIGCGGLEYEIPVMVLKGETSLTRKILIHGALMMIGWGFLLPSGVIIARLAKHRPASLWFRAHTIVQSIGLAVVIIGWIIALQNFSAFKTKGGASLSYPHAVCGMITMVLGILQPINALMRPHPPKDGDVKSIIRYTWELVHKGLGYCVLILAVATIVMGTTIVPEKKDGRNFQIAYGAFVGLLVLLITALLVDKSNYKPVPSDGKEQEQKFSDDDEL